MDQPGPESHAQRRTWPIVLLWVGTIAGGVLLMLFHWIVQAGWCGYFDGGPEPGQEPYCEGWVGNGGGLAVGAVPLLLLVVTAIVATRTRRVLPVPIGIGAALLYTFLVPFQLVRPACEGVTTSSPTPEQQRAVAVQPQTLVGRSEDELCASLGKPSEIDPDGPGRTWIYPSSYPAPGSRVEVVVEDGRVTGASAPRP